MENLILLTGFEFMYNLLVIFFPLLMYKLLVIFMYKLHILFSAPKLPTSMMTYGRYSYGCVTVRSYSRYDVNGFRFRSAPFDTARPRAATTNSGVVTRAINEQGQEINYYRIIHQILEFSFVRDKELKVVFFVCNWFDSIQGI
jgi:hypothetical protein